VTELSQTLVNAVLLIVVAFIGGSIGLKRFDAVDRRIDAVDRRFDELRAELKADIARVDAHVGELRAEVAQTRSDLTYVALAVGARRAEGSG
jgi:cell division protein FtsB